MPGFRWSNIPVPEGHLYPLLAGLALSLWRPLPVFHDPLPARILGGALLLTGILLAGWAVAAARDMELSSPERVIESGPYRFSRNPMFLAWTAIYLGITLLVNTWWPLFLLPGVLIFTHLYVIRGEEQRLEEQFGQDFRRYRERVRRYH